MNRVTRTSVGRCDRARGRGDRRITRSAALERERRRVAAAAAGPGGVEGTGAALHVPQATRLGPQGRKRCAARRICGFRCHLRAERVGAARDRTAERVLPPGRVPPAEHPVAPLGPGHRNRRRARAQGARLLEHGRRRLRARRDRRARPLAPLRDRGLREFRPEPNVYGQRGRAPRLANERRPTQASTPTSTSARATCFRPTTGGAGAGRGRTSSTPPGILGVTSARTRTSPTRPGSASSTRRSAARSRSSSTPASTSARPHAARGPGSWRSSSRRSTSARAARRPRRPRSGGPVPTRRRVVLGKACCHWQCVFSSSSPNHGAPNKDPGRYY